MNKEPRVKSQEQGAKNAPSHGSWLMAHGSREHATRGFTLVEMLVSIALFAIVMLISIAALLALTAANKKAQALQSVMNNLNVALDDTVRTIRTGSNYRCGSEQPVGSGDCSTGSNLLYITPYGGTPGVLQDDVGYLFDSSGAYCGKGRLCKVYTNSIGQHVTIPITSSDITINSMTFYVVGTAEGDTTQPKVVMTVSGTAGATSIKTTTTFHIQATAVQRLLDL